MNYKRREGYSLVEVSLALLVAGFGIMAAFALFPEALGQSRKSVEATEVATFADYVFAELAVKAGSNSPTAWSDFGVGRLNRSESLDSSDPVWIYLDKPNEYQKFWWRPWWYAGDYRTTDLVKYRVASFTYNLQVADLPGGKVKRVRLEVWPGDIPTPPTLSGKVFYRHFVPLR